jgi:TonB-linked SusC/RagA family outer membrane protein
MSLMLMLTLFQVALAQTRTVSGRVLDQTTGEGLPGVTVLLKGTTTGISTNASGRYSLNVPESGGTLVFSSVGMVTQEIALGNRTTIDATLAADNKQLSEIVVVGYGTQSKALVTGAVATVDAKQFRDQPVTGLDQALQGRASGVQVTSSSGTPGGGVSVRIRGANSITASSEPLYVVDGVPINTGSYSDIGVGNQTTNALADINPNDIASMEILKDASASAIYGSRAANGVVLITTKHGQQGRTKISVDVYGGVQQVRKKLDVLNGQQAQDLINESRTNVGLAPRYVTANPTSAQLLYTTASTNWQDQIFRNANISNYTLSASGGDARTTFLVSGSYFNQDGIILGSGYKRGSGRLNLEHKLSDKVKFGTNLTVARSTSTRINNDNNIYGVLSAAILTGSQTPIFNADGTYAHDPFNSSIENPVAAALVPTFTSVDTRAIGNFYLQVEPVQGLVLRSSIGGDYLNLQENRFIPSTLNAGRATSGLANANSRYDATWLNENTATYSKAFGDNHVSLLLGQSAQKSSQQGIQATATTFATNLITQLAAGAVKQTASSDATSWTLLSYFSRLNYDYKGKYLLTAGVRGDGSSRFGANNKYGYFPSVALGWRISQEAFLINNPVISELKLRGGYGKTGNFNIGNFSSYTLYGVGATYLANYNNVAGLGIQQLGNPDLTWEKSSQINVGVDFGVFNNRVLFSANVFKSNTDALLQNLPLPLTSGFYSLVANVGALQNKGLELEVTTQNVKSDVFSWTSNFNISFIRNQVTKLANPSAQYPDGAPYITGFASRVEVGQPLGAFYGYVVDKIYQSADQINADNAAARTATGNNKTFYQSQNTSAGDIRFKDLNGDGVINSADQQVIGSAQPKFFGGFNNQFSYKGIDLGLFFQYTYGNSILNVTREFAEGMNSAFGQLATTLNRWTPTNTNTDVPRAAAGDPNGNTRNSTRFLEDGSYMRLKTATLGYNLPKPWSEAVHFQNIRIYFSGQNLLTFTKYSGLDPEVSTFSGTNTSLGTDFLTFPQARTYQVGINLGL